VVTIVADANLDGHAALLDARMRLETWREIREYLDIRFVHLEEMGLDCEAADVLVWRLCQERGYYLLTANRNHESEDSLEATIQREGTSNSLPVFTFADAQRVHQTATYLDKVVEKLLDYLLNQDNYRGCGRLFLP
jgi:hypothetical protein